MSGSSSFFSKLFGSVNWTAPPWCQQLKHSAQHQPGRFWSITVFILLMLTVAIVGGYYYAQLPKPIQVIANISAPEIGYYQDDVEQPSSLILHFEYESQPVPDAEEPPQAEPITPRSVDNLSRLSRIAPPISPPIVPLSTLSAAKLDLIGEVLSQGVTLSPNIAGKWLWQDDNTLSFTPEQAWPAGQQYKVSLDKAIFAPDIKR